MVVKKKYLSKKRCFTELTEQSGKNVLLYDDLRQWTIGKINNVSMIVAIVVGSFLATSNWQIVPYVLAYKKTFTCGASIDSQTEE